MISAEQRRQPNDGLIWVWIAVWVVLVVIAASVISIIYWDWLSARARESNSSTIRNIVLAAAAVIALPLAIWRSKVAARQAETAQLGLLNDRYQKGAEMLGSKMLPVRLGGIYALARLAREHPEDYHTQIMSLLCAFVRHPTGKADDEAGDDHPLQVREDVQAVMWVARVRLAEQVKIEEREIYLMDFMAADLKGADLMAADLTRVNLQGADLQGADLGEANLAGTYLTEANLAGAYLAEANLNDADLRGCKGLTQEQLDRAVAHESCPPDLSDVVDANTGKPLVWRRQR